MLTLRRTLILIVALWTGVLGASAQAPAPVMLKVDAQAPTTAFPHFWEKTFGSGRAILALRDDYRADMRVVKEATNFESVRFHGILTDEVGCMIRIGSPRIRDWPQRQPTMFPLITSSMSIVSMTDCSHGSTGHSSN